MTEDLEPGHESPSATNAARGLRGQELALLGRLASMNRRQFAQLVRNYGGRVQESWQPGVSLVVLGEGDSPVKLASEELLSDPLRAAAESGEVEVITESQLWERLGLIDGNPLVRKLYTPAMLAELLQVPVAVIRRWHRRGLIVPSREVHRLPYFDFQEVAAARQLAGLLAAGLSPQAIEKKLVAVSRFVPQVERSLNQLQVILQGQEVLLRQGSGLIDESGQFHFDFGESEEDRSDVATTIVAVEPAAATVPLETREPSLDELLIAAAELEDQGNLSGATDLYRSALAQHGPNAGIHFLLAEALYQMGEPLAARERYFAAIEIDEHYVEARANLGCVLWELQQKDLAIAAFEGALAYHPDYADVHFHLAKALDEMSQHDDALVHWQRFLDLAPDSPWAEQALDRISSSR